MKSTLGTYTSQTGCFRAIVIRLPQMHVVLAPLFPAPLLPQHLPRGKSAPSHKSIPQSQNPSKGTWPVQWCHTSGGKKPGYRNEGGLEGTSWVLWCTSLCVPGSQSFHYFSVKLKHSLLTRSYFSESWSLRHRKPEKLLLLAASSNS